MIISVCTLTLFDNLYFPSYYDGAEYIYIGDPQLYFIYHSTAMFQTLFPNVPICVYQDIFTLKYMLNEEYKLRTQTWSQNDSTSKIFIHSDHLLSLIITMVVKTLRTHNHALLIIEPEYSKLSLQPYLYSVLFTEYTKKWTIIIVNSLLFSARTSEKQSSHLTNC